LDGERAEYCVAAAAMTGGQETALERQSRLRERARQLREKREAERLAFVEQKYEQQFRSDFDQWRRNRGFRRFIEPEPCVWNSLPAILRV